MFCRAVDLARGWLSALDMSFHSRVMLTAAVFVSALLSRGSVAAQPPSVQQINDEIVARIRARIAGHEREPAGQVFKNVQFLKATPAATFLVIMNVGYSKALGVACSHCHNETDFASDEKRSKKAAREMQTMHRGVNDQLKGMQNLSHGVDDRAISCITCHRGEVLPFRG